MFKPMKNKKSYRSPKVEMIQLDRRISIQMTSPPGDPPAPIIKEGNGDLNPFK